MDYSDYLSITLTALAVLLAALTLGVGVLALWGYSQFRSLTREASRKHVSEMLNEGPFKNRIDELVLEHVSSQLRSGQLREILINRIDQIILSDAEDRARDENPNNTEDEPYED